jgi:hypothetical protein
MVERAVIADEGECWSAVVIRRFKPGVANGVLGLGLFLSEQGAADRHDGGDDTVDAVGALVLGGLEVAGGARGQSQALRATLATCYRSIETKLN